MSSTLVLWLARDSLVVSRMVNAPGKELNQHNMKPTFKAALIFTICGLLLAGCRRGEQNQQPVAASTPPSAAEAVPITLPVLNALFADEAFKTELKSKLQLTDEQINTLRKVSSDEVAKLRKATAENQSGSAEASRQNAIESIRAVIGSEKSDQLMALARDRWNKGSEELAAAAAREAEPTLLTGPNAVPKDTRIVVNIPAFRMDVFAGGTLIKSYKIGIGYQQFPLPTGFRKAEMIIFNPTWTQPNESWASNPGLVVPAGSKGNPLGPIKIPIGGANLIHGGKELAKIGTFASHGCVGLTNDQVKDFAKVLGEASNTELKEDAMAEFLKKRTRTQVVKLEKLVPVELRYETIVVENGVLHIYRDVYNKKTNTEENLRAVFEANGVSFDSVGEDEKTQVLEALNVMSTHPKKQPTPKPTIVANQNSADKGALAAERKAEADRQKKLRNQKEFVIDVASLSGKGYPPPKDLNTGVPTGTPAIAIDTTQRPETPLRTIPTIPRRTAATQRSPTPIRASPTPAATTQPSPTPVRTSPTPGSQ
jgi:lipoprotein-anchoring transpeptidase ErfK/SrfK